MVVTKRNLWWVCNFNGPACNHDFALHSRIKFFSSFFHRTALGLAQLGGDTERGVVLAVRSAVSLMPGRMANLQCTVSSLHCAMTTCLDHSLAFPRVGTKKIFHSEFLQDSLGLITCYYLVLKDRKHDVVDGSL